MGSEASLTPSLQPIARCPAAAKDQGQEAARGVRTACGVFPQLAWLLPESKKNPNDLPFRLYKMSQLLTLPLQKRT